MAARRAESIRNMIHGRVVGTEIGSIPISMNLGVAGSGEWRELNAERLIHEADIAFYRPKETGRNRCVVARPSGLEQI
jgi:GGDEF domain-containing protein